MKKKPLLKPSDFIVTDGKKLDVYENLDAAENAQEEDSYKNPGTMFYVLQVHSGGLLTKKDVKEIKKKLAAIDSAKLGVANAC